MALPRCSAGGETVRSLSCALCILICPGLREPRLWELNREIQREREWRQFGERFPIQQARSLGRRAIANDNVLMAPRVSPWIFIIRSISQISIWSYICPLVNTFARSDNPDMAGIIYRMTGGWNFVTNFGNTDNE